MACESQQKQIYIRLDDTLLARIDQFAERLAAEKPGLKPSRSDAVRVLLYRGLDAAELDEGFQEESR